MTARCAIAACAATGLEAAGLVAALQGSGVPALTCHAAACCCVAGTLHRRLLDGSRAWAFALVFAGAFFIPVAGAAGIVVVALAAAPRATSSAADWVRTAIPEPRLADRGAVNADGLRSREARLEALAELRGRNDPGAIALLRRALEDSEEDVRLLAYSLLESKSRTAYRAIHESTRALEEAPGRRHALHRLLAFQHWELAWLGLAEGECLSHALEMARRHALAALESETASASLYILLGRIHLRSNAPGQAAGAFAQALQLGAPRTSLAPWLAEAAYAQRRFDLVRGHLLEADLFGGSETVERLRRYWT